MEPKYLEWDSKFFNCTVGQLILRTNAEIFPEEFNNFDLVYLMVEGELTAEKKKYFTQRALFVDEKLTYEKKTTAPKEFSNNIRSWPSNEKPSADLLKIGVASGEFSRFNIDPQITNDQFIGLYKTWIIKSVNRKIAKEVYGYWIDNHIAGAITLTISNNKPTIGILAVDEKFRGRRIASQLIAAAEYWAKNINSCEILQVVTQGANKIACNFYEKCGFNIQKKENIFHWWNKNTNV